MTLRLAIGALLCGLSGHRIRTKAVKEYQCERAKAWRAKARRIQDELDEQHARGWGRRAIDKRRVER